MMATTNENGDIHLTGNDAVQAFGMLQSTVGFDGEFGLGNFFNNFETSLLDGGGGSGYGIRDAVTDLHFIWGVEARSYGGNTGFNNIVNRIMAQGAEKMNYAAIETRDFVEGWEFYNLTASETVREQVFNNNFDDALGTILSAYKDVFKGFDDFAFSHDFLGEYKFSTFANQSRGSERIHISFAKSAFVDFAYCDNAKFLNFNALVRSIYHEFEHGWDFSGSNGHNRILFPSNELAEFRAYYNMANNNIRLPQLNAQQQYVYWNQITNHNIYGNLFNALPKYALSQNHMNEYRNWYNVVTNFLNTHNP